ncbi:MAG: hypothetical protein AB1489_04865 [Acidobacteriota bacterium]
MRLLLGLMIILLLSNLSTGLAQDRLPPTKEPAKNVAQPQDDKGPIKVRSELVVIDVAALDKNNRFVKELDRSRCEPHRPKGRMLPGFEILSHDSILQKYYQVRASFLAK